MRSAALAVLLPLVALGAVVVALSIVRRPPAGLFGWSIAILFGVSMLWILVSVLWPAHAERRCQKCGRSALVRLDPNTTHGVRCEACGFEDESQSSWLLAEEEGPLEDVVLASRKRKREPTPANSPVDSGRPAD